MKTETNNLTLSQLQSEISDLSQIGDSLMRSVHGVKRLLMGRSIGNIDLPTPYFFMIDAPIEHKVCLLDSISHHRINAVSLFLNSRNPDEIPEIAYSTANTDGSTSRMGCGIRAFPDKSQVVLFELGEIHPRAWRWDASGSFELYEPGVPAREPGIVSITNLKFRQQRKLVTEAELSDDTGFVDWTAIADSTVG